jgi:hypothetical protein
MGVLIVLGIGDGSGGLGGRVPIEDLGAPPQGGGWCSSRFLWCRGRGERYRGVHDVSDEIRDEDFWEVSTYTLPTLHALCLIGRDDND